MNQCSRALALRHSAFLYFPVRLSLLVLRVLKKRKESFHIYESTFSDILGIIAFLTF